MNEMGPCLHADIARTSDAVGGLRRLRGPPSTNVPPKRKVGKGTRGNKELEKELGENKAKRASKKGGKDLGR